MKLFGIIILSFSMGLFLSACQVSTSNNPLPNPTLDSTPDEQEFADGTQALGVKNYRQIFETMQTVTGLQSNAQMGGTLMTFYNTNRTSLPADNDINSLDPSKLLTVTNLAYEFCARLMFNNNDQTPNNDRRVRFFGAPPFNAPTLPNPSVLFSSATNQNLLATTLLEKFWGSYSEADVAEVSALIASLTLNLGTPANTVNNDQTGSQRVLAGACTAVLGSARVILF